nr:MAG TPA: hypothetical protein [Caudoviricetes sp.]
MFQCLKGRGPSLSAIIIYCFLIRSNRGAPPPIKGRGSPLSVIIIHHLMKKINE